jgi:hypothetical protein
MGRRFDFLELFYYLCYYYLFIFAPFFHESQEFFHYLC